MNILLTIFVALVAGILGVVLAFFGILAWSRFESDPTAGGAYVAMFMLSAVPVFAVCAAVAVFICSRFMA